MMKWLYNHMGIMAFLYAATGTLIGSLLGQLLIYLVMKGMKE